MVYERPLISIILETFYIRNGILSVNIIESSDMDCQWKSNIWIFRTSLKPLFLHFLMNFLVLSVHFLTFNSDFGSLHYSKNNKKTFVPLIILPQNYFSTTLPGRVFQTKSVFLVAIVTNVIELLVTNNYLQAANYEFLLQRDPLRILPQNIHVILLGKFFQHIIQYHLTITIKVGAKCRTRSTFSSRIFCNYVSAIIRK